MLKTYKLLSLLLSYPNEEIFNLTGEAEQVLNEEGILDKDAIEGVLQFCNFFSSRSLVEWQEHYVQLFDYSRGVSLYLFEHLHGDSKDRGQAMVDLINLYEEAGVSITASELPDYLPVFLEFLSLKTPPEASKYLAEIIEIAGLIHSRLAAKDNPFKHLLSAIISLSVRKPDPDKIANMSSLMPEVSLDEAYEEKPVTFGCEASPNICDTV